jgi:AcrR family transcriptional regulator
MPRPKSLAASDIAAAALAILDREGLAALSMRSVAEELGMATMSLYRYVTDRAHLEQLAVERVLSEVATELPARLAWRKRVTLLCERVRSAVAAHPSIVPLTLLHRHTSASSQRWAEALLGVLTEAGFSGAARVIAFRSVLSYLVGVLQVEHLGPLAGTGTRALAQLPEAVYPLLVETARQAQKIEPDSEFRLGLAIVLRGLQV